MEILSALFLALAALAVPFVVPFIAWRSAVRARRRLDSLEGIVSEQRRDLDRLIVDLQALRGRPTAPGHPAPVLFSEPAPFASTQLAVDPSRREADEPAHGPARPAEITAEPPPPSEAPRESAMPRVQAAAAVEPEGVLSESATLQQTADAASLPPTMDADERAEPAPASSMLPPAVPPAPAVPPLAMADQGGIGSGEPPPGVSGGGGAFDWERLVGVKLFSAIAGIALVIAAVFFLRYSIESGWLQPFVRVAIGVIVATGLLVACELKAARRYPVTANALDAAAVAILFATFFAAHALWNLIPSIVTFFLLALVTVLAVLLSIRRESLFIAVLGLLGGFATPALLSTGENRPIPLFGYLLLLNVGLAWVAYQRRWAVLTWLSVAFTTLYQWGWVLEFMDRSSLPLAMGIFAVFPVVGVSALLIGGREGAPRTFERAALISAMLPLLFAAYLAAVPEFGERALLLFGFLLLIDLGLLAIAIARRQDALHAAGAAMSMGITATWMAASYTPDARPVIFGMTAVFVVLYLLAPAAARRAGRPFESLGARTDLAAPLLLFVFPVSAAIDRALSSPWALFGILFALVLTIAARAIALGRGVLYFLAAFFAVAAQATWSAARLTPGWLGTAAGIFAVFGLAALGVPFVARRVHRPLEPAWGSGAVLLASLGLLLFISTGRVAPAALWALALLLAILNAAVFIESAAGKVPLIAQIGSVLSWIVLATWWERAAGTVGVIPSLAMLTGLSLVTLGGHAWTAATAAGVEDRTVDVPGWSNGAYLGLIGHLFLALLALNREWALPPWPLFGALAVITLACSAASLIGRSLPLHTAGVVGAALVVAVWSAASGPPNGLIALTASAAVSAYAVVWIGLAGRGRESAAGIGAVGALLVGGASTLLAVAGGGAPPYVGVLASHGANAGVLLWIGFRFRWPAVPLLTIVPAWLAVLQWQLRVPGAASWTELLTLAGALYAVFVIYPLALGARVRTARAPYLAAVAASAMFFFGARDAFLAAGLEGIIGVVPIIAGGVLALLLRQLLSIEPAAERDTGRIALVAGAALAFVTVAIPLQLRHQWITIGWALEGAALAWLYRRVPHRGLLYSAMALLATVFVRLALNPEILLYEPRGATRILNWYLYTYAICAGALLLAGWWLSQTDDRVIPGLPAASRVLTPAGVILLFLLLNIEIADFFATGPTVTFRFGVTVSQDLTYTIGWLAFGMALLAAGIYTRSRAARVAAIALIAITAFKCFLYDLGSLAGLHRVASFVGLAISLALVSLALQKFVLSRPRENA